MNIKNKLIATSIILTATIGVANAGQIHHVDGVVKKIDPVYQKVTKKVPNESCNLVDVPVYGNAGSDDAIGDIIIGSIIGGAIGNNVVKGDGAGAAGAVIGGLIANEKSKNKNTQTIVGYRQTQQCTTTYTTETFEQLMYNTVTVNVGGFTYKYNTKRNVNVGDVMSFKVRIDHK